MEIRLIAPSHIKTTISLPASKSISNRVLIIHSLSEGNESLYNLSDCDDTRVMIEALNNLPETIDIGAAGTAMRFLTAYFSTKPATHILTGTERMKHRPIKILVDALRSLGASIEYTEKEGFPPLRIKGGKLYSQPIVLEGNISSQYISALLLIAPTIENGLSLKLTGDIISRPYINMTLQLMHSFGIDFYWTNDNIINIAPQQYKDLPFSIESDWSAASYWYEITALCEDASVELKGLKKHSFQGDSKITEIFEELGVHTTYTKDGIVLNKIKKKTHLFTANFSDVPDIAQTVVTTCALSGIHFHIEGLQTLKIKETDRIEALKIELKKLGFILQDSNQDSVLSWTGERCNFEENPIINTYNDHRMALALSPACFFFKNLRIQNPEVINKSYTNYWKDLTNTGFQIEYI